METKFIKIEDDNFHSLQEAADIIKKGGLVAFPTETVYGLGANALNPRACGNIFKAKGRPGDNPLIIHICDLYDLDKYTNITDSDDKELVYQLAQTFMPGPLTMVLPKAHIIPYEVTSGLETVAVRFPSHKVAKELIRMSGVPIAAPSANLSGSPSPTCAQHVISDLDGRIEMIVDGGMCEIGLESTIIMPFKNKIKLLRPGGITVEQLSLFGEVEIDKAISEKLKGDEKPLAPGMKYRHYAPEIPILIVKGDEKSVCQFFSEKIRNGCGVLCFEEQIEFIKPDKENIKNIFSLGSRFDQNQQARMLFEQLRNIDKSDINIAYAVQPDINGIGFAVYNRLIKACGFEVIEV